VRVQREGVQLQAQGVWSAGEADDKQRFLADLRALRDTAALEFDELAARAHYPSDVLKEAESGPSLPSLPILAAYVRACDGDVPEWEERWRRLGVESIANPGLPVRLAGASPAAVAGARAAVSVAPPDAYDPERIKAALRGSHGRSGLGASRAASRHVERDIVGPVTVPPVVPEGPASWDAGTSWGETKRWDADRAAETAAGWGTDTGRDRTVAWSTEFQSDADNAPTNGNHYASQAGDALSDSAVIETPDTEHAEAIRRDPFSTDWLQDSKLTPPPDPEPGWQDRTEAEAAPAAQEDWFTPREPADREQSWSAADSGASSAAEDTWFTPRERAEDGLAPTEPPQEHVGSQAAGGVTGFWTPARAAPVPAEVQQPGPQAQERVMPQSAWPASTETPADDTADTADRTMPVPAQAATAAPSRTITGPAVPPGPVVPPSQPRPDRIYPVRLLMVIVVAALIGSILVLILR
jgi:hypothetical protein